MPDLVSVDIETTGLDPLRHEAWEIAVVPVADTDDPDMDTVAFHFHMPVTGIGAEGKALEVGQFLKRYECPPLRYAYEVTTNQNVSIGDAIRALHAKLKGKRLLGCAVHFDAAFLSALFMRHGFNVIAPWHHRHLDLGSYAGGHWGFGTPQSSTTMQKRVPNDHPHTAFGDAQWNIDVWNKINTEKL